MRKINVSLYGGDNLLGKSKLIAEINYCKNYENCSLYNQRKECTTISQVCYRGKCPYSGKERIEGVTSRSNKYKEFKNKYQNDPLYNQINPISNNCLFAVINDYYYFDFVYLTVKKSDNDTYHHSRINKEYIIDTTFNREPLFINKEEMTVEFLDEILSQEPRAFFNNDIINGYREKIVPNLLIDIKRTCVDLYNKLIAFNPKYANIMPNYIGEYAYINTLNQDIDIQDIHGNIFHYHNNTLTCKNYNTLLPFSANLATVVIPVTNKMTVKVMDNNWCNIDTILQ